MTEMDDGVVVRLRWQGKVDTSEAKPEMVSVDPEGFPLPSSSPPMYTGQILYPCLSRPHDFLEGSTPRQYFQHENPRPFVAKDFLEARFCPSVFRGSPTDNYGKKEHMGWEPILLDFLQVYRAHNPRVRLRSLS